MNAFEKLWRNKISHHTEKLINKQVAQKILKISINDPVEYSKALIESLNQQTSIENVKNILACSACNLPHLKLHLVREVYRDTQSIEQAISTLRDLFKDYIKFHANLSDDKINELLKKGWGFAGKYIDGKIIVTKIPTMLNEYENESNPFMKRYYYCHCPRVKKELIENNKLDSIYCNCGGGFYKDMWEYITEKPVHVEVLRSLFDGYNTCQFEIQIN